MSGRFALDQGQDTPGDTVPAAVGAPESLVVHLAFPLGALVAGPVEAVLDAEGDSSDAVADNPAESLSARMLTKRCRLARCSIHNITWSHNFKFKLRHLIEVTSRGQHHDLHCQCTTLSLVYLPLGWHSKKKNI